MKHIEIERKFLIRMPDIGRLMAITGCRSAEISQTYLENHTRLRRWCEDGRVTYIKTVKHKLTEVSRIEEENEIPEEEYKRLLLSADKGFRTIEKVRYSIPFGGKLLEIDVFPFWQGQAYLEIELEREDEEFSLPDYLEIIREVTLDPAYKNYALAKNIPKEENF